MTKPAPGLETRRHLDRSKEHGIVHDLCRQDAFETLPLHAEKAVIVVHEKVRAEALQAACDLERHHTLIDMRPPFKKLIHLDAPGLAFERLLDERQDFRLDDGADFPVECVHLLEMAKHCAQADLGLLRHARSGRLHFARADQLDHRAHNLLAAAAGPLATAVSLVFNGSRHP